MVALESKPKFYTSISIHAYDLLRANSMKVCPTTLSAWDSHRWPVTRRVPQGECLEIFALGWKLCASRMATAFG